MKNHLIEGWFGEEQKGLLQGKEKSTEKTQHSVKTRAASFSRKAEAKVSPLLCWNRL